MTRLFWDSHVFWDSHTKEDRYSPVFWDSPRHKTPTPNWTPIAEGTPTPNWTPIAELDTHTELDTHHTELDTHRRRDTHTERDSHKGTAIAIEKDSHRAPRERDSHRGSTRSGGFVLIATLWTLAAMAVFAAYIDGVASADIERAAAARAGLERELAQRSTEATLAYLLSTGRMNHRGLMLEPEQSFSDFEGNRGPDRSVGVIAVAGETYRGVGDTRFSIQDENGLVSVNFPRTASFAAMLSHVGVQSAGIDRIVPRVGDYVDMDEDLSLSGAERFDYDSAAPAPRPSYRTSVIQRARDRTTGAAPAAGSLTPVPPGATGRRVSELRFPNPSNWIMATPLELRRVLGVDDLITPDQRRRLMPMLTIRQTAGYNFNTMPRDVLAAVLELDAAAIGSIVAERAERPVSSLNRVALLTGLHLDIDPADVRPLPSRFLRVSIWHNASGLRSIAGMALTPFGDAPWRIDYRYMEPLAPTQAPEPARTPEEPTGANRDPTEPAIDNESSDIGVLQAATPLLQ